MAKHLNMILRGTARKEKLVYTLVHWCIICWVTCIGSYEIRAANT